MNQKIYDVILQRILFCEYAPGRILNEQTLADEFKVSRTPLRGVLSRLEWEKLLRIVPRTGAIVTELEFHKLRHVFQLRFEIEDLAGKLAGEHATGKHLEAIKRVIGECRQLAKAKSSRKLIEVDLKFRDAIYDAAGNPIMTEMSQYLYNLTLRLTFTLFGSGDWADRVRDSADEYGEIYTALSEGDPIKVGGLRRKWLRVHLDSIKDKM